ncbi:MAG: hypothetical protein A2X70_06765 [Alphaproteobacteria bacterium GWC2_42_16]|nr:MAG: hypothetical protein A2X70_06765 [Alphaproteobacteria bacterium GWC2_42_16]OFW84667.1 MAG: hypothetical protein A3E50_02600 [Alphaproteobacteria bacterium RIFCSPHIGHO2_12_FULL_42_100]OFW85406.1 MAG: hypothetical protein A2W06_05065 [Alphaproteobacteria bacterium RBG_16_42_14]OFW92772.1 MAG: hypothetical protein A3C41_06610 [Alphaproteobacteria bacterium RIFCSPHIGHO2_02_FULL_42_30]OFX01235.1 MAG: hypothetical protein A2W62_03945 [Alphaproteobacteria bacterium RIFCSPLOWO2_02_42_7]
MFDAFRSFYFKFYENFIDLFHMILEVLSRGRSHFLLLLVHFIARFESERSSNLEPNREEQI